MPDKNINQILKEMKTCNTKKLVTTNSNLL